MKVLNYSTSYFAVILLILISIWAAIFYYAMLDEIYDSIDDGLDNQKGLIIQKVSTDSSILRKSNFEEGDYAITETSYQLAKDVTDVYVDTMMYMQNEKDFEPVRLLRKRYLDPVPLLLLRLLRVGTLRGPALRRQAGHRTKSHRTERP